MENFSNQNLLISPRGSDLPSPRGPESKYSDTPGKDIWTSVLAASKLLSSRSIKMPKIENRYLQMGDSVTFLSTKSNEFVSSEGYKTTFFFQLSKSKLGILKFEELLFMKSL